MAAILVGFQMVGLPDFRSHSKSGPFANQPLFDHSKSGQGRISDPHCSLGWELEFWQSGFQIAAICVQWGSEIWPCPDFEWSKRGWFANGPGFKWDLKYQSPTIWKPTKMDAILYLPYEIRTLQSGFRMVLSSNGLKPDHLKTRPFEIRTSKSPDFRSFRISDPHCSVVWNSDGYC